MIAQVVGREVTPNFFSCHNFLQKQKLVLVMASISGPASTKCVPSQSTMPFEEAYQSLGLAFTQLDLWHFNLPLSAIEVALSYLGL